MSVRLGASYNAIAAPPGGFSITVTGDEQAPSRLKLRWSHHPEWDQWARLSEGVYILRINITEWTDEALWKTLQQWQSRAGLGHSPRTILEEFSRIHAADIVLPLADASKRELRIRCVVRPDRAQAILLQHLGLTLPERLRPPQIPVM
ncbi:MAG: hypothetical protein EPO19_13995 [Betaproteobacteria bacterium]|nr:MAG: hypothetical protein EPO19_13995 [Betaproteobacteria bacterium]